MNIKYLARSIAATIPALFLLTGVSVANAQDCPLAKKACPASQAAHQVTFRVSHQDTAVAEKDIVDTAVAAGSFKTLVAAAQAAGLVETLKSEGPFTILAPSDEAFANLPEGTVESLLKPENKEKLAAILTYHVIAGKVMSQDVVKLESAKTVQGNEVKIKVGDKGVTFDKANLVKADIECSNGVIHVIDSVLIPSDPDIVDTAVANGNFKTLAAALTAAELIDTLKGDGPFTVFAPNDDAFAKIPAEAIENLLKPENKEKLQGILTYHVISGKVMAADVVKLETATTVNGHDVAIAVDEHGVVTINGTKVIATDIKCGNGVIHVIDSVLMPK